MTYILNTKSLLRLLSRTHKTPYKVTSFRDQVTSKICYYTNAAMTKSDLSISEWHIDSRSRDFTLTKSIPSTDLNTNHRNNTSRNTGFGSGYLKLREAIRTIRAYKGVYESYTETLSSWA